MTDFINNGRPIGGRLAADATQFYNHINAPDINLKHKASDISLTNTQPYSDVQSAISSILGGGSSSGNYVVIGDGLNCYPNITTPYYDTAFDTTKKDLFTNALKDLFTNPLNPGYQKTKFGCVVLIKAGTYLITDTIHIPSGVSIVGEGNGTRLINAMTYVSDADQKPMFFVEKADSNKIKKTVISNLLIADNFVQQKTDSSNTTYLPKNTVKSLVSIEPGSNIVIDNVRFEGFANALTSISLMPISIDQSLSNNLGTYVCITNCLINKFQIGADLISSDDVNFPLTNTSLKDNFTITNNKFYLFGKSASSQITANVINSNVANISITNNFICEIYSVYVLNLHSVLYLDKQNTYMVPTIEFPVIIVTNNNIIFNDNRPIVSYNNFTSRIFYETNFPNNYINSINFNSSRLTNHTEYNNNLFINDIASDNISLMQKVNSKFTITIGDGISSFGEFNGVTAFQDALIFIEQNSITNAVIEVKKGNYNITNINLSLSHIEYLKIIGLTDNCKISGNPVTFTSKSFIDINNIEINFSSTFNNSIVNIKDCIILKSQTFKSGFFLETEKYFNKNIVNIENCNIQSIPNSITDSVFYIVPGESNRLNNSPIANFTINNCESYIDNSCNLIKITPEFSGVLIGNIQNFYSPNIVVKNSNIYLGNSVCNSNSILSNKSIFDCITKSGSVGVNVIIDKFTISNCKFLYNRNDSSSTNFPLYLYFNPKTIGTTDLDKKVKIKNINISNLDLLIESMDYTINPIIVHNYISSENNKISIDNLNINTNDNAQFSHGKQPSNLIYESYSYYPEYSNEFSTDRWGLVYLDSNEIKLINSTFQNLPRLSSSGDLVIRNGDKSILLDNLTIKNYIIGDYNSIVNMPYSRINLEINSVNTIIKNINLVNDDTSIVCKFSNSLILLGAKADLNSINLELDSFNLKLSDAILVGSNQNMSCIYGLEINPYKPSNGSNIFSRNAKYKNIKISNMNIQSAGGAIAFASLGENYKIESLSITDNYIDLSALGILVNTDKSRTINISNNNVTAHNTQIWINYAHNCTNSAFNYVDRFYGLNIINNSCYGIHDNTIYNIRIEFSSDSNTIKTDLLKCIVKSNNCINNQFNSYGELGSIYVSDLSPIKFYDRNLSLTSFSHGLETKIDPGTIDRLFYFSDGERMLYNLAILHRV